MRLDTEIVTSQGVTQCTIKRTILSGAEVVEVDLYRGSTFLDSSFTVFRSGVFMKWDGHRYKIVRRKRSDYSNNIWVELENLISNTIIVNE